MPTKKRPNILVIWGDMTLATYPPVQGGKSFDMSNVVEQFMSKGHD